VLPRLLAAASGPACVVVAFPGVALGWAAPYPVLEAEFEHLAAMFAALDAKGCRSVVFAGAMTRPRLDLARLDPVSSGLVATLNSGDDSTLRAIADLFAANGLTVIAAQDVRPDLLAGAGVLGACAPSAADLADIRRAAEIAGALGQVDVGQAVVVAQGLCLGLETLQGTDRMLEFVTRTAAGLRPDPVGTGGVLFKAAKPGQDLRFDLPAIGPATIRAAAAAGLAGVAVTAGGALLLERQKTLALAECLGLFVYGLPDGQP